MLPKIEHPLHSIQIPSNKRKHNFRPFLVREEKILLMAKESADDHDILRSIKQIVNNCCVDDNFHVDNITVADLGYLFIQLRIISVDSKIKQSYKDIEDDKIYDFEIDLNKIQVIQDKIVGNNIKISNTMGLILKYPTADIYNSDEGGEYGLIPKCIDKIYEGEEIYDAKNYSHGELTEWINNLLVQDLDKINEFIVNMPRLEYIINYKNSLGNDRQITLSSLNDFFSFR